jgi:hypothetical protein
MVSLLAQAQEVSFPTSAFVPLAVGFFGLGTGYLIYGPQERRGLLPGARCPGGRLVHRPDLRLRQRVLRQLVCRAGPGQDRAGDGRVREPVGSAGRPRSGGRPNLGALGERALGFFHVGTGLWLMYLTWATVLNITSGYHLPL